MTSKPSLSVSPIDKKLLPRRALLDTGVVMRALGDRPSDPDSPICRELFEAMLAVGADILIAAPTLAEMLRKDPTKDPPRTSNIIVVPFDQGAARALGLAFPHANMVALRDASGLHIGYWKFDAMIAACALRHRADAIIAIDPGMRKLGASIHIEAKHPNEYRSAQTELNLKVSPKKRGS